VDSAAGITGEGSGAGAIPADVRFQAENMFAVMPEPPRELPVELIRNERYCLFVSPMPSMNIVQRIRVESDALMSTVDEVCELLRSRGRTQAAWTIDSGATPAGLEESLLAFGMVPYDEPPLESSAAAMAIVTPPSGSASDGIEAREVRDHEEVDQFIDVEQSAVGLTRADSDGMRAAAHTMFDLRLGGRETMRFYLASRDGEPVGAARASFLQFGVNLSGGAVTPAARSQGVYRALINARWNDAVAAGTPALTVQAGHMSRPILDRLGFVTVAQITTLCHRFD
jgi:GNAT superfamily N-acetyltransferase